MSKMKRLFIVLSIFLYSDIKSEQETFKIGLGSCNDQNYFTKAWKSIENEDINTFFFLGDNVYGDIPSGELTLLEMAYQRFNKNMPDWFREVEIYAIWDDHDYGLNDGGANYRYKFESQTMFKDFWRIDASDPRMFRNGVYFSDIKEIHNMKVLFIGLDTRFFRSELTKRDGIYLANEENEATVLGEEQWLWFKKQIIKPHDILILGSSIQVLATGHRFEKWANFPLEREKLLSALDELDSQVILVSGDRHRGGIYRQNKLIEITASSLNRSIPYSYESDKLLLGNTHTQNNYGLIELAAESIKISLKNEKMDVLEYIEIPLK